MMVEMLTTNDAALKAPRPLDGVIQASVSSQACRRRHTAEGRI